MQPIIEPLNGSRFRVEVDNDLTHITGRAADMQQTLDLSILPYIESDGLIQATIYDPLPDAGAMAANGAVRVMRQV